MNIFLKFYGTLFLHNSDSSDYKNQFYPYAH